MKIQFTIWNPRENFKKLYRLYAKDEAGNDAGYIQFNLTSGRVVETINVKTSNEALNKVIRLANDVGLDLFAYAKQFTINLRSLDGKKREVKFLEI